MCSPFFSSVRLATLRYRSLLHVTDKAQRVFLPLGRFVPVLHCGHVLQVAQLDLGVIGPPLQSRFEQCQSAFLVVGYAELIEKLCYFAFRVSLASDSVHQESDVGRGVHVALEVCPELQL